MTYYCNFCPTYLPNGGKPRRVTDEYTCIAPYACSKCRNEGKGREAVLDLARRRLELQNRIFEGDLDYSRLIIDGYLYKRAEYY